METLRIAIFGCGFWSRYQIPAWLELPDVECIAVCDVDSSKTKLISDRFGIPNRFVNPEDLFQNIRPDLVDIITSPATHSALVERAAQHRVPVICQKPMANDFETAQEMVRTCQKAGVPFFVHENWRWQRPIREVKKILDSGQIGTAFRARIDFNTSFPAFDNQPFLRELERFAMSDMGSHIFDVARFLFGEAQSLTAQAHRVNPTIRGEDVATVLLKMENGMAVMCNLSFASRLSFERFPETFILIEGAHGSIELGPDFWIRITDQHGTTSRRHPPPTYSWADPDYALVHASIVDCHRNLVSGLRGTGRAETTATDNLRTLQLVFRAYESAHLNETLKLHPL
jgi:predicted dehydrogenase